MDRGIVNQTLLDAMDEKVVVYYETVDITLTLNGVDTVYKLCNAPRAITIGGDTYESFGQLLEMDSIKESAVFEINDLSITLSGLQPYEPNTGDPLLEVLLRDTTKYIDRPVQVNRAFFNLNNQYIDSIELFKGYINTATAFHHDHDTTTVTVECSSHFVDFQRRNGRRTNSNNQQYHFPADTGMRYAIEVIKDIEWKPAV